jgi:hypothetical protein
VVDGPLLVRARGNGNDGDNDETDDTLRSTSFSLSSAIGENDGAIHRSDIGDSTNDDSPAAEDEDGTCVCDEAVGGGGVAMVCCC